jgi:hypothetical protein
VILKDVYLGDGLYAHFDGYQIELYAFNGVGKTASVFLEPAVLKSFLAYVEDLKRRIAADPAGSFLQQ